jgi:Prokaryotic E2 family D
MQSRTFLRIEGDLVSLVTEMTDREVTLPDLLTELTSNQLAMTPRLPTGCRFWLRSGSTARAVFVLEQPPQRRTIAYQAGHRYDAEPVSYRLALPYVVFVVSTYADQIEGLATFFRTEPVGSLDAPLFCSTLPNTNDDGLVCLGSVRVSGTSVGERVDALVGAFWGSRFNADLRRHPLPFSGGFRAWASRSRRDPLAALSLAYDPYWRSLRQVVASMAGLAAADLPMATPDPASSTEAEVHTPEPVELDGGDADALAS